ncbi:hypothetical protein V2P20_13730 [Methylobacter sp. Wu1]|uniref:hypothetical protein n=1 Tax=Methylobacter sp. Wu1 TaxID=3119359 RepID=UPI002F954C30
MNLNNFRVMGSGGTGGIINRIQTLFVGLLRIWTIPIVLLLSLASGFTTYYGMSHFITPWIALIITVAIQSIIVICSLEIAGIHWKANRIRYISVLASLLTAIAASVSFSYFQFYEISEKDNLHIERLNQVRDDVNHYLNKILAVKTGILEQQRAQLELASREVSQAYFGTHPQIAAEYRNQVGEGPFWKHYNELYQAKAQQSAQLEQGFRQLDDDMRKLQAGLRQVSLGQDESGAYQTVLSSLNDVQLKFNQLATGLGHAVPEAPAVMSYAQFVQGVQPSFLMWKDFSPFAFVCASMIEFFTVLLSYRLEMTAPGPLTDQEEELVFECLRQFTEFRINENDELEMVIEKSELERARRYSDWSRMFAVGLLLSRGFLRKVDARTVEFAPNLYPLIAQRMGEKIRAIKAESNVKLEAVQQAANE